MQSLIVSLQITQSRILHLCSNVIFRNHKFACNIEHTSNRSILASSYPAITVLVFCLKGSGHVDNPSFDHPLFSLDLTIRFENLEASR